jgi:alpha-glucuronidase
MMGRTLHLDGNVREKAIILGTINGIRKIVPGFESPKPLQGDGFLLASRRVRSFDCIIITSTTERGVLYGGFAFLSMMARGENVTTRPCKSAPSSDSLGDHVQLLNGTIERGYAGHPSLDSGGVRADLTRAGTRLGWHRGINGALSIM